MKKTLYGIPNCDTVKKARTWLAAQGHDFDFHDFKKQGLARAIAAAWLEQLDWEVLVNRKGTTWRNLPDERKAAVTGKAAALELILEQPSVVKRPVLDRAGQFSVGFSEAQYLDIFSRNAVQGKMNPRVREDDVSGAQAEEDVDAAPAKDDVPGARARDDVPAASAQAYVQGTRK